MVRNNQWKSRLLEKLLGLAAFAAVLGFGGALGSAAILNPGDTGIPVTGTYTLTGETLLPAYTTVSNGAFMSGPLNFDFKLTTTVYHNPGTGGLDFVYQLQNTAPTDGSGDSFDRVTFSSFSGYSTDADYQANTGMINFLAGDLPPVNVDRSAVPGSVVGFNFVDGTHPLNTIDPGDTTDYLIVRTNATGVTMGSASVIDSFAENAQIQAPFGAVSLPEPASFGLIGVASFGLLKRRRRSIAN